MSLCKSEIFSSVIWFTWVQLALMKDMHYLKIDLNIFSLLLLANCIDISASASEAIAPRRSVIIIIFLIPLVVKIPRVKS